MKKILALCMALTATPAYPDKGPFELALWTTIAGIAAVTYVIVKAIDDPVGELKQQHNIKLTELKIAEKKLELLEEENNLEITNLKKELKKKDARIKELENKA